MLGNTTRCPKCRGVARFLEGSFDVVDGGIDLKSGPEWSWLLVEDLRLTLRRILDELPEDPIAEVEAVSPELGGLLRRATRDWTRGQIIGLIATIAAVLTWAGVAPSDITAWLSDAEGRVVALIESAAEHGPPPSEHPPPAGQ
jgi:hypothetical protein